jgi:nucleoside 2-deoxyribosyltransferase
MAADYLVYAAGPITGLTFDGAVDWRDQLVTLLADTPIGVLSPMRGKHYLRNTGTLRDSYEARINPLSTPKGIITRDRNDVRRADLLIVNMVGAQQASIGTLYELAWAFDQRTPVILVMEPEGNIHEHAFVRESVGFRVETLAEAAELAKAILLPGYGSAAGVLSQVRQLTLEEAPGAAA